MEDIIYGRNAVLEALKSGNRTFNKILISKTVHPSVKIDEIINLAKEKGVLFQFTAKENLSKYDEHNHQGIIAMISPVKFTDLDEFLEREHTNSKIVMLDGVEDSQNLGSIIRTSVCAGVDAIIVPERRTSPINSVVEKASAGAINHIEIIKVNSPVSAIQKLKKLNWWVIAAEAFESDNYYDVDYNDMNFVLVMGAEHSGVSKSILKLADFKVKIPMLKNFNSLNVSNALSIIIFESVRQSLTRKK